MHNCLLIPFAFLDGTLRSNFQRCYRVTSRKSLFIPTSPRKSASVLMPLDLIGVPDDAIRSTPQPPLISARPRRGAELADTLVPLWLHKK